MDTPTEHRRPTYRDILAARHRIADYVVKTKIARNVDFNRLLGCDAWFKCENLQMTGAFKMRGASNAVVHLRERGISEDVATHSSGNHGAALARAARLDGRKSLIVMPHNSVQAKIDAVRSFGGKPIFCEPNEEAREAGLAELVSVGYIPIPPFDHTDIIAGQGTAALEFLEVEKDLDILMTPVGGGGLISGSAIVARQLAPAVKILAAEPIGAADTAESFGIGRRVTTRRPDTIADGLRATVGEVTFPIINELVDDVLTVTESGIKRAVDLVWENLKMIIEPSSATVVAAIMEYPDIFAGKKVGMILSGGNIDFKLFPHLAGDEIA